MGAFDEKNVQAAIARIPAQSSKVVRDLRDRAEKAGISDLVDACTEELAARPVEWTGVAAVSFEKMADDVKDMGLVEAIRHAFVKAQRADADEIRCIRWIAAHPGATYQEAASDFGKGGLSLVIGHLVYSRYGCFKRFFQPGKDQSSVLIEKDRTGAEVRYTLRPEAAQVFGELGILD